VKDAKLHETLYRGEKWLKKLASRRIVLCGAGSIGSLLTDNLIRLGVQHLRVIDDDRVDRHNVGSQLYGESDIGGFKADVLRAHCFRVSGVEIEIVSKRLTKSRVKKMLKGSTLVVDTFDNSPSRKIVADHCEDKGIPCVHMGMNADYGEVKWNEGYRVPADVLSGDICEYPLARNLILLVVAVGSEALLNYCLDSRKDDFEITLRDLSISRDQKPGIPDNRKIIDRAGRKDNSRLRMSDG